MTPDRTGSKHKGHFRHDRVFKGVGRVRITSGTSNRKEFYRRDDLLTRLYEDAKLDVLEALRDKRISIVEVLAASRNTSGLTMAGVALIKPWWPIVDDLLRTLPKTEATRRFYTNTLKKLRGTTHFPDSMTVRDLMAVDWTAVRTLYGAAASWNHLVATLSTLLSSHLGDVHHPFRKQVMGKLWTEKPNERVPDVSVAAFWRCVARLPEYLKAPVQCMALTGLRVGEYLTTTEESLRPLSREIVVTGKTGQRVVAVAEEAWPIIAAAIPPRYARADKPSVRTSDTRRYRLLQKGWKAATDAEGITCTPHDLRHLSAQLASDAGMSDGEIMDQLGHSSSAMTRRYTRKTKRTGAANATAAALLKRA
jgi:integrase